MITRLQQVIRIGKKAPALIIAGAFLISATSDAFSLVTMSGSGYAFIIVS